MQRERASGDGKEHKLLPVYPNGGPFTGERAKVAGNAAFLERFLLFPARPGSFGAWRGFSQNRSAPPWSQRH